MVRGSGHCRVAPDQSEQRGPRPPLWAPARHAARARCTTRSKPTAASVKKGGRRCSGSSKSRWQATGPRSQACPAHNQHERDGAGEEQVRAEKIEHQAGGGAAALSARYQHQSAHVAQQRHHKNEYSTTVSTAFSTSRWSPLDIGEERNGCGWPAPGCARAQCPPPARTRGTCRAPRGPQLLRAGLIWEVTECQGGERGRGRGWRHLSSGPLPPEQRRSWALCQAWGRAERGSDAGWKYQLRS